MDYLACFSQSSMASLIARPMAPFLPPYFIATLARNSRSKSFGSSSVILPILHPCVHMPICLNYYLSKYVHVPEHTAGKVEGGVLGGKAT